MNKTTKTIKLISKDFKDQNVQVTDGHERGRTLGGGPWAGRQLDKKTVVGQYLGRKKTGIRL